MIEVRRVSIFRALLCCVFSLGVMAGCAEGDSGDWETEEVDKGQDEEQGEYCEDQDGDGFLGITARCPRGTDCNDLDANINTKATEICGDGIDNDCRNGDAPCERECVDADGDGYGDGPGCLGLDCDDTNAAINPGAREICGNEIDENCDGADEVCLVNCTDLDGDGYGPAGQNSDCPLQGDDCDDSDASRNPGAQEVCNGVDDNCDGQVDECEQTGAECSGTSASDACVVQIGASCSTNAECESPARCDSQVWECRLPVGESCTITDDCLAGYVCNGGVCSGEFCDLNTCSGDFGYCSSEAERCVECNPDAAGDGGCPGTQTCSFQGFCADALLIADADPVPGHPAVRNDIYALSLAVADCWIDYRHADRDELCQILYLGDDVGPITEEDMKSAFVDGHLNFIDADRHEALDDLWGEGFWNVKNIHWRSEPQPGSFLEYCVWYDTKNRDEVIVENCSEFSP